MAKNQINYNILLVGGVVLGGLYLFNQIKKGTVATDYTTGLTGQNISDASQPTIKTDLRQTGRTERALGRQETSIIKAENQQDTRLTKVQIRQDARTLRAENRQATRSAIWDDITGLFKKK